MKCILSSARRAISGRWFFIATFAALATMWLSVGNATYTLMDNLYMGSVPDWAVLLSKACLGQFGMLTLPALSAMPFASQALHELRSGVARFAIFRTGRKPYIAGQIVACIFSAMTMQAAAFALLITALSIVALHAGVGGHSGGSRESCDSYFRWTYDMCWLMDGYWMHACFAYRDGERGDNCTALSMLHAHYVY